jgi:hypothetical protein
VHVIDPSELSLNVVLLHNENIYSPIPVAFAIHIKECYENMQVLSESIGCDKYR